VNVAVPDRKPVIIVSEDEFLVRMFTADFLDEAGFEVLEARNAHEALRLLESRPDVAAIVTDVEMPGAIDGLELARRVRQGTPGIAVVIVSGRVRPAPHQVPSGAKFVSKPFEPSTVLGMLQDLMGYCPLSTHREWSTP
jgi:CheY-like chemotaxis protein